MVDALRHQANLFFFAGTNQKGLYSHFAETELHSGRMSKRQLKIVEKNLQREEKLKESMSYVEAPQKDHKVDEMRDEENVDMRMPQVS